MLNDGVVGSRADSDCLLGEAVEELPSMLGGAPIESKSEFVQVGIEVLTTDSPLMRAQQPALQKGGNTMDPWKKRRGIFGAVLDDVSRVAIAVIGKRAIGRQPITHDHAALLDHFTDEGRQAGARPIGDPLQANAPDPVAANLGSNDHQRLVSDVPTPSPFFDPADERLVDLDLTGERLTAWPNHRPPQFVQPGPCRLVAADSQYAVQADGTGPVLLPDDPPHRVKPETERLPSVLKDGASGDGHCGLACATPKELVRREPCFRAPAVRASKALGPPQLYQVVPTGFLRGELVVEFGCRSRVLHGPQLQPMGITQVKVIPHLMATAS